jgi:hypothetical protein
MTWCIVILITLFLIEGIPGLVSDLSGNFCHLTEEEVTLIHKSNLGEERLRRYLTEETTATTEGTNSKTEETDKAAEELILEIEKLKEGLHGKKPCEYSWILFASTANKLDDEEYLDTQVLLYFLINCLLD